LQEPQPSRLEGRPGSSGVVDDVEQLSGHTDK
jgi:hypothetical protein